MDSITTPQPNDSLICSIGSLEHPRPTKSRTLHGEPKGQASHGNDQALRVSDGKRYRVRFRTPEGRQTDKRGFRTKKEAEAFANTVEVKKLTGSYVSHSAGRVTVGDLGPDWVERQKAHMKASGHRSYDSAWRIHVEPRWGDVAIGDIRFSTVQSWVAELTEKRGPVIVQTAHSVLSRILDDAVRDNRLSVNPRRA
ncbi:hypothetical protein GS438_24015 [Rhodococcus hoagii]|nr:hypothetical protein [Prescottella equi]